jgi:glycosyltransferase involved in cell wall biosynthesis
MKLVLGTNIWSPYQATLGAEFARLLGQARFRMVLFDETHSERRPFGWGQATGEPWLIGPPADPAASQRIASECLDADIMVFGDCPRAVLDARTAAGKLTFVASERLLKKSLHRLRMLNPRYALGIARFRKSIDHPHVHSLSIGSYAPDDLRTIGMTGERIWRWGYFVSAPTLPPESRGTDPLRILWVGRVLGWKRVDTLLRALALLRGSPRIGQCVVIGDGPDKERLQRLAVHLRLDSGRVRFQPAVPFGEVRSEMRKSAVYVLPSGRQEGWGVVANEAMSEGCVLVANEEAGASRELVTSGQNGLLFKDGDAAQLAHHLDRLSQDLPLLGRLQCAACRHITSLWSPAVAAERFLVLSEELLSGSEPSFSDGPCSRPAFR